MPKNNPEVMVTLTLEWSITHNQWKESQDFYKKLKENPKVTLESDIVNTLFTLNEITLPLLKKATVK